MKIGNFDVVISSSVNSGGKFEVYASANRGIFSGGYVYVGTEPPLWAKEVSRDFWDKAQTAKMIFSTASECGRWIEYIRQAVTRLSVLEDEREREVAALPN